MQLFNKKHFYVSSSKLSLFQGFSKQIMNPEENKKSLSNTKDVFSSIMNQRNDMKSRLTREQQKKQGLDIFTITHQDIVIGINLFMRHDCKQCQQTQALMNYYQISYSRQQNILFLDDIKKSDYIKLDKYDWPVMKVQISLHQPMYFTGQDQIIGYLINSRLIPYASHITHSAWSQQGQEFIRESIDRELNFLFLNPFLTWQNIFKTSPEGFKDGKGAKTAKLLMKLILRGVILSSKNLITLIQSRNEYRQSKKNLLEAMNQWKERLQGQDFHGGNQPDEADFELFATIMAKYNSYSFRKFIENEFPIYGWFIRMQQLCRFEENRFYTDLDQNEEIDKST